MRTHLHELLLSSPQGKGVKLGVTVDPVKIDSLEAFARGGYRSTRAEWAVLSWKVWLPFHMFVDAVDAAFELRRLVTVGARGR